MTDDQTTFDVQNQMQVQVTASVFADVLSGYASGAAPALIVHNGGNQCDITAMTITFIGVLLPGMNKTQQISPVYEQNTQSGASSNFNFSIPTVSLLQTLSITDSAVTADAINKTGACTYANLTAMTLTKNGYQQISAASYAEACNQCDALSDATVKAFSPNIIYKKTMKGMINMTISGVSENSSTIYGVQYLI